MTARLKLGSYAECPTAWRNFFEARLKSLERDERKDVTVDAINQQLKEYHAVYRDIGELSGELMFESKDDLTIWLLKWS